MAEATMHPLRRVEKSIPDRPRSPPRYAPVDTLATTKYVVPGSENSWARELCSRPCPTATVILEMCQSGELSRVHTLMEKLPSWVEEDFRKRGLQNALDAGQVEVARFFLEQGAKLDENKVLEFAKSEGKSIEMFELFVEYGWNVNTPGHGWGYGGHTVLGWAVNDQSLVRWLLSKGADPNFGRPRWQKLNAREADNESGFALDEAASTSTAEVIDLLIEGGARLEYSVALHEATEAPNQYGDRIPIMQRLLELGFDVDGMDNNVRGPRGHGSPLMSAVRFRNLERAKFLLKNGANPYLKNWRGKSPFDEAQRSQDTEFLDLFQDFA